VKTEQVSKTSIVLTIQWRTFYFITRITKRTLHELNTAFFTNSCNAYKIRVIIFCHITLNSTLVEFFQFVVVGMDLGRNSKLLKMNYNILKQSWKIFIQFIRYEVQYGSKKINTQAHEWQKKGNRYSYRIHYGGN
jgi:hypothetical protein